MNSAPTARTGGDATSVSTHILDTSLGRPARAVAVQMSVRAGREADWRTHAASATDDDGRCKDLPALPEGTTHVRLRFEVEPYFTHRDERAGGGESGGFFPEVTTVFAVTPGEHHHVPLLLNPYGYSVYRGS